MHADLSGGVALDAAGRSELEAVAAAKPGKLLLVIGGEDRSVGQFILNMADDVVGIAQRGRINSLNASVAAGIALFALGQVGWWVSDAWLVADVLLPTCGRSASVWR